MIKIEKSVRTDNHYISCPHCLNILIFGIASPVYCPTCREELSNYSGLVEDVDERRIYYLLGKNWELGTI